MQVARVQEDATAGMLEQLRLQLAWLGAMNCLHAMMICFDC